MGVRWEGTLVSARGRTWNNLSYVLVCSYPDRSPPSVLTPTAVICIMLAWNWIRLILLQSEMGYDCLLCSDLKQSFLYFPYGWESNIRKYGEPTILVHVYVWKAECLAKYAFRKLDTACLSTSRDLIVGMNSCIYNVCLSLKINVDNKIMALWYRTNECIMQLVPIIGWTVCKSFH